jgi:predicted branched-subunit amino acid permease
MEEPYKTILIALAIVLVLIALYYLLIHRSKYRFLIYGILAIIALSWVAAVIFSIAVTVVTGVLMGIVLLLMVKSWKKDSSH